MTLRVRSSTCCVGEMHVGSGKIGSGAHAWLVRRECRAPSRFPQRSMHGCLRDGRRAGACDHTRARDPIAYVQSAGALHLGFREVAWIARANVLTCDHSERVTAQGYESIYLLLVEDRLISREGIACCACNQQEVKRCQFISCSSSARDLHSFQDVRCFAPTPLPRSARVRGLSRVCRACSTAWR